MATYGTNMPTIAPNPVAAYYPEAQLSSGGFGFQLRNQQAQQFIDALNAKVASGQMTQEQANQAWAQIHEAGNEADRARETSGRLFDQSGLAMVGSMGLGGLLAGGSGGDASTGNTGASGTNPTLGQVGNVAGLVNSAAGGNSRGQAIQNGGANT